jgi:hypothetical protein
MQSAPDRLPSAASEAMNLNFMLMLVLLQVLLGAVGYFYPSFKISSSTLLFGGRHPCEQAQFIRNFAHRLA